MQLISLTKIYGCISLKIKDFSHETEALILIGGGETHSELLIEIL